MASSREHQIAGRDSHGVAYPVFPSTQGPQVYNMATPEGTDDEDYATRAKATQDRIRALQRPDISHWEGTHAGHNRSAATASSSAHRSQSVRPEGRNSMEHRWPHYVPWIEHRNPP